MSNEFLTQDEVDALLKGVSGDDDEQQPAVEPRRGARLQPRHPGAHRPRADAHARGHQRALRAPPAHRPVQLHPPQPRDLGRPGARDQVQRVHPQPGRPDQHQHRAAEAAARQRAVRVRAHAACSWSSTTCSAATAASTRASRVATSRRPSTRIIRRMLQVVFDDYQTAWKSIYPLNFDFVRSEMHTQFANIATPTRGRRRHHVQHRPRRPAASRSTSAFPTRRWSRSATCSTARCRATTRSPTSAGCACCPSRSRAPRSSCAPTLLQTDAHRRGSCCACKVGDVIARRRAGDRPGDGRRRADLRLHLRHAQRPVRDPHRAHAARFRRRPCLGEPHG